MPPEGGRTADEATGRAAPLNPLNPPAIALNLQPNVGSEGAGLGQGWHDVEEAPPPLVEEDDLSVAEEPTLEEQLEQELPLPAPREDKVFDPPAPPTLR